MNQSKFTRRDFVKTSIAGLAAVSAGLYPFTINPIVSVVKIRNGQTAYAVEKALDLLGGIEEATQGKSRIMLKPNLVGPDPRSTTNPEVIRALALLLKKAGKDICIAEGSAAAPGFNMKEGETYRTNKAEILDPMQKYVFDELGYTRLGKDLKIPLINLHSGEMKDIELDNGLMFKKITVHKSVADTELLCSVPMMKTHVLATVTLGMKNLIGVYPGSVYYSVRAFLHDKAAEKGSPGIAYEIVDMARASKMGLTVIDASTAMEGDGPSDGELVKMNLIIAGTNPLATDIVGAAIMGFDASEIPTFEWAINSGMSPTSLEDIEVRGEKISDVKRRFKRPQIFSWNAINKIWGVKEF